MIETIRTTERPWLALELARLLLMAASRRADTSPGDGVTRYAETGGRNETADKAGVSEALALSADDDTATES